MSDRERQRFDLPLPEGRLDRVLLALGAGALLALVPIVWIWLLYGGVASPALIYGGGIGLSAATAAIGAAMIRLLDGRG